MRPLPLILLAACASEPTAEDLAQRFVEASGLTFADCGSLDLGPTCEGEPDAAQEAAVQCLTDAYASCTPSRLDATSTTIEGDPIRRTFYVYPIDDGQSCGVEQFTDASEDAFGSGEVTEETCTTLRAAEACPWFVVEECSSDCGDADCG